MLSEADDLVLRAEHLLDIRRTGDALALLRQAIAADPTHVDALCSTARAYLREGQLDDAGERPRPRSPSSPRTATRPISAPPYC